MADIFYIKNGGIDREKWDNCILSAENSLLYAHSVYLDAMCNWDALVMGDYETVMPLPCRKKFGINYLYQPAFTQQLGIFSKHPVTEKKINEFITAAMAHYRFAEICLNYNNPCRSFNKASSQLRNNYVLNLEISYENIYKGYSSSLKRKLSWIKKFGSIYNGWDDVEHVIDLYRQLYGKKMKGVSGEDFRRFVLLCKKLHEAQKIICRIATNYEGEKLAALVLLNDGKRIYNIISCITEAGKKVHANDFIYDSLVREFSGKPLLLDFEGSDMPGIADFYMKFSPVAQPYPFIKWNQLPALLKLVKK
ncbi:MAG: hypothetical protein WAT19_16785 [Ferruginibacter sp.]